MNDSGARKNKLDSRFDDEGVERKRKEWVGGGEENKGRKGIENSDWRIGRETIWHFLISLLRPLFYPNFAPINFSLWAHLF